MRVEQALHALMGHISHISHVLIATIASLVVLLAVVAALWGILYRTELRHVRFVQDLLGLRPKVKQARRDPNEFTAVASEPHRNRPSKLQLCPDSSSIQTGDALETTEQIRRKHVSFDIELPNS